MAAPLQLPFIFMIRYFTGKAMITPAFLLTYYTCCTIQVALMLYIGYGFVHLLWKWGFNPDNNSIPILTALADLMGSSLFALGFLFLYSIQDPNAFNDDGPLPPFPWHSNNSTLNATMMSIPMLNSTMMGNPLLNATMPNTTASTMSSTSGLLESFVGNLTQADNFTNAPYATTTSITTIASTLVSLLANSTQSPFSVLN